MPGNKDAFAGAIEQDREPADAVSNLATGDRAFVTAPAEIHDVQKC
jgi:hypothetical protein